MRLEDISERALENESREQRLSLVIGFQLSARILESLKQGGNTVISSLTLCQGRFLCVFKEIKLLFTPFGMNLIIHVKAIIKNTSHKSGIKIQRR